MSSTAHLTLTACRTGLAGAGAAVLLAACAGGDSSSDSAASGDAATDVATDAADTSAPAADSGFCTQAAGIDDRVDAAVSDVDGGGASIPEAFRRLAVELRAIEAPPSIAGDWETMAGGLDRMADAVADVDITDLSTLDALDAAEGDLSSASDHVETYLRDECGIAP
jgi:hypothetical protein